MNREALLDAAREAHANPAHAQQWARVGLRELDKPGNIVSDVPEAYLYAGAHNLIARAQDVPTEPLPENVQAGTAVGPIWWTNRNPVQVKIPFDVAIIGVSGWAFPALDEGGLNPLVSAAPDGRDLFSVAWGLNGDEVMFSSGDDQMMVPACSAVGTRTVPRPMYWEVQSNEIINVWFRNLSNVIVFNPFQDDTFLLSEVALCFKAINLSGVG